MLEIRNAKGGYGTTMIFSGVNIQIKEGEKVALLGRNGTGKTTLLKYIMGLLDLQSGEIYLANVKLNKDVTSRAQKGIAYVPQGRFVFDRLTVRENIAAVAYANGFNVKKSLETVFEFFPILIKHQNRKAESLSGGQQQILAIARALTIQPKIMLLDEPSEGIQPSIIDDISGVLRKLSSQQKMTLFIAEQNLDFCMSITERAIIMDKGGIAKEVSKNEISQDKNLLKKLLAI